MKKLSIFIIFIVSLFIFIGCIPKKTDTSVISLHATNGYDNTLPSYIAYRSGETVNGKN